ncbi:MAG: fatty acid oxidation complex subunit alpha FadJ [Pseudomonadota bacterium]
MSETTNIFTVTREDEFAILTMDVPGEVQNTLRKEFGDEILPILESLENDQSVQAVIFTSAKNDSFVAGADIDMLKAATSEQEVSEIAKTAQKVFQKMIDARFPIVAAVNGACLGGGYELALACHARVATDENSTVFGLPEVQLGLLPAGGGTQRLPRLIGISAALDIMLTGKRVKAKKAVKLGMVDEVVAKPNLLLAAKKMAKKLLSKEDFRRQGKKSEWYQSFTSVSGIQKLALEDNAYGRKVLFDQARKRTIAKTLGNYPAPEKIIDCIEDGFEHGMEYGFEKEAQRFGQLAMSPESKQLINIFKATTEMKKGLGVDPSVKPRSVEHVTVLGGGLMGAGIAYVSAEKAGKQVRIKDRDETGVNHGLKYVHDILKKRVKRKSLAKSDADWIYSHVTGTTKYDGMKKTDLVVEAVFENLELKHQMVKDIEAVVPENAIFATNTSSIPITQIAEASTRPENVIGLHYFSPVEKMPLLEIIVTEKTAQDVIATAVKFGHQQGKTVIVVNDGPGFYTSRILGPYMNEAAKLVEEGVPVDWIDEALKEFGFPVGPITLLDEVGIDVGSKIAPILQEAFGERMAPPPSFAKLNDDDRKGRKNQRGFYLYEDGKSKKKEVDESVYKVLSVNPTNRMHKAEIAERCALMMLNEAAFCLQENIVRSERDADIGAIFGLGFPPFLGGPFRYADTIGVNALKEKLERLQARYGDRFKPADIIVEKAEKGEKFYQD